MSSDEERISTLITHFIKDLENREIDKLEKRVTHDLIYHITDYPPMIGKKKARENLFGVGSLETFETAIIRSVKIRVAEKRDLANAWGIFDSYIENNLIMTWLFFSGWIKKSDEWLIESVSSQVVEPGWTW